MTEITLRQAQPADWPAIDTLLRQHGLPTEGARAHLATFVVALANGELVACAGAEPHGRVALLRSVAVAPGLQSEGLGQRLVSLLLHEAQRRGVEAVYLLTTTAAGYFRRHGFVAIDRASAPATLQRSAEFQGACPASAELMMLSLAAPQAASAAAALQALPVVVLGAGPVGLAAAAQLIERGLPCVVLEAADTVAAHLVDYGHVRLFSPWRYNVDPAMARLLAASGWQAPPDDAVPLAREVVERVLQPFARLPQVAAVLQLRTRVQAVSREGFDKVKTAGREAAPFLVRAERDGQAIELRARAVIDATGTWGQPNPLGASGLPALGEAEAADRIAYGIPDVLGAHRERYAGRTTLVVGAGHSAANALLDLATLAAQAPGTRLLWSVRSPVLTRVFGGGDADALPARGALGSALRRLRDSGGLGFHAGLRITRIVRDGAQLRVVGLDAEGREQRLDGIDQIICATGQRPDLAPTRELRLALDPWLESNAALGPLIDPNLHSCGTVRPHGHRELAHPEPGFYTVGVKSYGRAPTFLMATGFEQARSVVAALAGDLAAADRVELDLPETGVCSAGEPLDSTTAGGCGPGSCGVPAAASVAAAAGCCGGPARTDASACCALDEQQKAGGQAGCGCGTPSTAVPKSTPTRARARAGCC